MPDASERLQNLPPYIFAVISQQLRQMKQEGIDVIRLDIGNPDLPPANYVVEALATSAMDATHHGYSGYTGIPAFRKAIAKHYQQRFNVDLNPDTEVLPLIGSKEGIINLSLAFLDRGDVALVPAIGYPAYSMGARLANAEICYVDMPPEKNFLLDISSIPPDVLDKAKIFWVNYPNNPTGAIADLDFYAEVVAFCAEHDILLASDNPYLDVIFASFTAPSALQVDGAKDTTLEFISFSKSYNMAGWRLGAAVGSASALKHLLAVKSNMDSGHFHPIYDAGITALENTTAEWIQQRNDIYRRRRDVIMATLPEIGLSAELPPATLYVWAKVHDMDATEYADRARREAHVSIAPGEAYGPGGNDYVRISVSVPDERLAEALERLKAWYKQR